MDSEAKGCSLASTTCRNFLVRKSFHRKHLLDYPKPVADDPISAKKHLSFPEFDLKSTCIPAFDLSDELSFQVTIPSTTKLESGPDDTSPWPEVLSDELLYEVAAQLSEEEEEEYLMNSIEAPANVCTPFEYK